MRRITTTMLALASGLALATAAVATPLPNSAVLHTRVFDDCPISILTTNNSFPGQIVIDDQNPPAQPQCVGFANLHTWSFSTDGINAIQFNNADAFEWSATLTLNGAGEGGLLMSPWWAEDTDGYFNVKTHGEIACFGGRLPFFSFTGTFGINYVNNTPIQLGITYVPRSLTSADPGQIVYNVRYNSINYTSGLLNFDQGNPAEDPPHGQWGALTPWFAGGHVKMIMNYVPAEPHGITATWNDIQYSTAPVPTAKSSWGQLKKLYR